uniref:Uncharacterized protein n=1 Tax=Meloidogyne enterolobii TaxID=390850 RepID=A0A6V7U3H4_MELEN|nr:unnamed protein product [Meloidogyne enterolobii]
MFLSSIKFAKFSKKYKEMIIVRCWLERLFNCVFEFGYFYKVVFNPEMINLLFDNDKTIPLQFHIERPSLLAGNIKFEDALKFILNHLDASISLNFNFNEINIGEQHINMLLNMLTSGGNKLPHISLRCSKLTRLYDLIAEYIATSRNCSKMVASIALFYFSTPNLKLNEKAEKVEIKQEKLTEREKFIYGQITGKITNFQIANIHNPKERFAFENRDKYTFIRRM